MISVDCIVVNLCAIKKGLGRDASFVETYSAKVLSFEKNGLETGCTGSFGCDVSTRTATDYCYIKHVIPLYF